LQTHNFSTEPVADVIRIARVEHYADLLVEEAGERVKGGGVDCVAGLLESVVDFVVCGRPVEVYAKGVLDLREVEVVVKGADWWDWGAGGGMDVLGSVVGVSVIGL
jgi:hypothetical protein